MERPSEPALEVREGAVNSGQENADGHVAHHLSDAPMDGQLAIAKPAAAGGDSAALQHLLGEPTRTWAGLIPQRCKVELLRASRLIDLPAPTMRSFPTFGILWLPR
jgi:hypothetical protein